MKLCPNIYNKGTNLKCTAFSISYNYLLDYFYLLIDYFYQFL